MFNFRNTLRPKLLPVAVFAALASFSGGASALSLTASYSYSMIALSGADSQTSSTSVDVLPSFSEGANSVFGHSYGNNSGNFGSRSSGEGTFNIDGRFHLKNTVTNTFSSALEYFFTFTIVPGELEVHSNIANLLGGEFGSAEIKIDIQKNLSTIADTQAKLRLDSTGSTFSESGSFSLGGSYVSAAADPGPKDASYNYGPLTKTVSLGVIGAGDSVTLDYDMLTIATGTFLSETGSTNCYGGEFNTFAFTESGACGNSTHGGSRARSGDPVNANGVGANSISGPNPAPEPGSMLLIAAGAVGLMAARRRRKR